MEGEGSPKQRPSQRRPEPEASKILPTSDKEPETASMGRRPLIQDLENECTDQDRVDRQEFGEGSKATARP